MTERLIPYIPPPRPNTDVLPLPMLRDGAINIVESRVPREGYPQFRTGQPGGRLFMTREEVLEATQFEETYEKSDGTLIKIARIELLPGHDTQSTSRQAFLAENENQEKLLFPPIDDITTTIGGRGEKVDSETFQRYLDSGYTVFDQHDRPLPGSYERVIQLLSLRTRGDWGEPLGMPVGNGTFASPGSWPAGDGFPIMPTSPSGEELAVLVYGRPRTDQSFEVWASPGGFGSREDIVDGKYSSLKTITRLSLLKTGFDISPFGSTLIHTEFALSSPTTINSGLVSENHLVEVPYSQEIARNVLRELPMGKDVIGAQWLSISALVKVNTKLRRAALRTDYDPTQPDQIFWSTHMRGLIAAVNEYRRSQTD
jgi:hypothetical protein